MKHLLFVFSAVILWAPLSLAAEPQQTVSSSEIICRDPFPCPSELRGRILFWIDVFDKWGASHRILHDNSKPERVYSVVKTSEPCTRGRRYGRLQSGSQTIENERKRVKGILASLAQKVRTESDSTSYSKEEERILALFPAKDSKELAKASKNVRCQEGNRDRFDRGLKYYAMYREMILEKLNAAKLPTDLQYLPFVESAYNPKALSRLNAAGLWQFMPSVGRRFGMKVSKALDERFDPEKATAGAAKYLNVSFASLSSLAIELDPEIQAIAETNPDALFTQISPFVITSYNYGLGGVRRAMRKAGTNYVDVLNNYSGRRFRTAVQNFYSSFLAARHVAIKATPNLPHVPMPMVEEVKLPKSIYVKHIRDHTKVPTAELKKLNPALTRSVWRGRRPIPRGYRFKLPKKETSWTYALASLWKAPLKAPVIKQESYRVRRGDTPCGIANRFAVSCRKLISFNDLGRRALIYPGQILFIPGRGKPAKQVATKPVATAAPLIPTPRPAVLTQAEIATAKEISHAFGTGQNLSVQKKGTTYRISVEPEETMGHYSEWLNLPNTYSIRRMNRISRGTSLQLGKRIRLPIKNDKTMKAFEQQRIEYHQTLQDEFHQRYKIVGSEMYRIGRGDSVWEISNKERVPIWLLQRFNPDLLKRPLQAGNQLTVPTVAAKPTPKENGN